MTTPTCSKCRRVIPSNDFNVVQNVAYCRDCNASYRLSDLTFGNEVSANIDLNHPPKGSWFVNDGSSTIIGAINRNPVNGVGFLFFALVWNGIVSILMLFVISGKLHHLHVPLPGWFPAPRTESGGAMSVGMTLFLWIFLTPFILVGLFVAGCCLSSLFGRTEVLLAGS